MLSKSLEENVKPAALHFRLLAMIYDGFILIGIWVLTVVLLVTIRGDAVLGAWVQTVLFIETFTFFAYFWIQQGQTLGMMAWRLRLIAEQPFTLKRALIRFIGALLSFGALGIGYLWILIDRDRRSWSDLLSNSSVIRYPKR